MHRAVVCKTLSLVTAVVTVFQFLPMLWSIHDATPDLNPFLAALGAGAALSALLFVAGRDADPRDMGPREALTVVTLAWVCASGVGALPFWISGAVPTYTDAFFEAMSGFTTTGASVLTHIEGNPRGILFWRSLTHWLGGMGIIVLSLAVLPMLGVGGTELLKAEAPGPIKEKLTPRVQQTALILWGIYVLFTVVQTGALLAGGLSFFDALTHTFGTVATGGFSPLNQSVGQYHSPYVEWVITLFMFLSGASFALHYRFLRGDGSAHWRDPEFCLYTGITVGATALVTGALLASGVCDGLSDALRYAAFQVVSVLTTTGFVTADFEQWPYVTQFVLLLLMFIGGCAGSTGGGMKNIRVLLVWRQARSELLRLVHPRGIFPVRVGGAPVERSVVTSVTAFFTLYVISFALSSLALTGLGMDVLSATTGVAACLGNVGPGLGSVGPMDNFSGVPLLGKWVLSFDMLLGRLEIYTVLLIFLRGAWRG